ncbi:Fasciclin-domain-containing protein [Diplocarpon rosae]|nr:Fasciclin-domain-containing protein [Diplocarpon rosae]
MLTSLLTSVAWAALVSAQTANMNLTQVLAANNQTLSTLTSLLQGLPAVSTALGSAQNITILAPSNDAFSKFLATPAGKAASANPGDLMALLEYHVLNGTYSSSAINTTTTYVHSLLTNATYTNVTGGQVVALSKMGSDVMVTSGLKEMSMVTTADVPFSGGTVHVIDTVLSLPGSPSMVAVESNLTALAGALTSANLVSAVNGLKDVTIFAPSNAAFQRIGSAAASLTGATLTSVLEYHVVNGTVGYAGRLTNMSLPTLEGAQVKIEVGNKVFVNSAEVVVTDMIVANGVLHVIDNVLNPANTTATPNPAATTQPVAFSGAASASYVPFTSGVSATMTPSSTSMPMPKSGAAHVAAHREGAVGVAALLGIGLVAAF